MATSKEFKDFILEQLADLSPITCKPMMGEYLLYYKGTLVGGLYDDRLLVKPNANNIDFDMPLEIPYNGAKQMYMVEDVDDSEKLCNIIKSTSEGLIKK